MSRTVRWRRFGLGLGALAMLGVSGCSQLHQRHVLYPNGDGRRRVGARPEEDLRVRGRVIDRQTLDDTGRTDVPLMQIDR
jgi:hypothetical protein